MNKPNVANLKAVVARKSVVLVVDDRPTTRSLVRSVLEEVGYRVFEAADGRSALTTVERERPDVVLLDIIMPDMDGITTLKKLREKWDEIDLPIIMLTVKDSLSDMVSTLQLGATDFISKPINFDILMARLNTHVERKRMADQIVQMRDTLKLKVKFRTQQLSDQGRRLEQSLEELQYSENRYSSLYNDTPSVFMTLSSEGNLVSINRYGAEYLGWSVSELAGQPITTLFHTNQTGRLQSFIRELCEAPDNVGRKELMMINQGGDHIWMRITGRAQQDSRCRLELMLVGEDVTESRHLADRLEYLSGHDELSGLLNRVELIRRLQNIIDAGTGSPPGTSPVLLYLDIDQFRVINDNRGHVSGDRFLVALGRKLGALVGPSDMIARVGGDEFCILLRDTEETAARQLAERIRATIESFRYVLDAERIGATVSIGVVPFGEDGLSVTDIMTRADAACYSAKQNGGNTVYLFKPDDQSVVRHYGDIKWAAKIQQVLDDNQLEFFAQKIIPAVNAQKQLDIVELLIRVQKQDGSYMSSSHLLSAVEEFHLGQRLDTWVISNGFKQLAELGFSQLSDQFRVAINVSGQSLGQGAFYNHVLEQIRKYEIPAESLCFEVTETAAISNIDNAREFFTTIRELGCQLALDDFGSGLSSYTYLKKIPADTLKIDGSFIREIEGDEVKLAIVDSIVRLAHRIGKTTVAEHVETEGARKLLTEMGVDFLQGNLIDTPKPMALYFR